ncbi:MAG: AMP-dependent synthetase [Paucimonas sp.]|nr:AMP-dependent synthetase [Paucimonas sp.]
MYQWSHAANPLPPDFNGPAGLQFQAFEPEWIEQPVFGHFLRAATTYPDRIALVDNRSQLTYAETLSRVDALACRLARHADRQPVGILIGQEIYFPIAALACLAAGRPYIPVDPKYPAARIASILHDAGATLVIASAEPPAGMLPPDMAVILASGAEAEPAGPIRQMADVWAPAVILYTSGSTGQPKGICNNQRALLQRVCEATNSSHLNPSDCVLLLSSPGTIAGEREMFAALLNGATLAICDPQRDGLHGVLHILAARRVTICYIVPALLRMLLRAPGAAAALASLRVLRIGGDITLSSDLKLFREVAPPTCHFLASFSATEMPAVFQWFVPRHWQPDGPRVPVGYPRPEADFCLLDEAGQPCPEGEFGELVVRSSYLAMGQWQDGALRPGAFKTDEHDPALRILHTGDMLRRRSDGLWELTARKDRQIKIHGQRVDTGEVEAILRGHAAVDDVAVIARKAGEETVALVAFIAARDADALLVDDLRSLLAGRVPGFMQPAQIYRLPSIPQLPGFKPDLAALHKLDQEFQQALARGRSPGQPAQAGERNTGRSARPGKPASAAIDPKMDKAVRDAVKLAWGKVLGADGYRLDLPFEECGGDSLKALELWFHIEEALGFKLGLDAMGRASRPSELEHALASEIAAPSQTVSSVSRNPGAPLIYLVPGILGDDPMQLRFRAAFGDSVRFKLIDYPGWRDTMQSDCSFDAIVDAAFRQVCADPPQQQYRLAGYSFGGIVAFELARRLVEAGHKVGMLALLDSRRWDVADTRPIWQPDEMLPETGIPAQIIAGCISLLVRVKQYRLLRFTCTLLNRHANRIAFRFRNRMTKDLRFEALRKWRASWLPVPVTLYVSNSRWPGEPRGYGWEGLSESLDVVYVGGTHATMIDKPGRETIAAHIRQLLERDVAPQEPDREPV